MSSFQTNPRQEYLHAIMTLHVAQIAASEYAEETMGIRFRFRRFIAMSFILTTLASSCTKSNTKTPSGDESVSSTSSAVPVLVPAPTGPAASAPSCGSEVQTHGQGYDDAARACLWDAYRTGRTAELALTRHTIEGDPITLTLRVRSMRSIDVLEDNRDRFGAHGVRSSTCNVLERSPIVNGRSGFVARGCAGNVEKIEIP